MNDELPPKRGPGGFLIALIVMGGFAIGFALLFRSAMAPMESPQIGREFPQVEAEGWINGPGLTTSDLKGQIVVVDAWAYWCGPCQLVSPHLIGLHQQFADQGVIFLGLTAEGFDTESIEKSRLFLESEKIPWANGYGAIKMLTTLEADQIPQFWIVDREYHIAFHEKGLDAATIPKMEITLKQLLSRPVPARGQ